MALNTKEQAALDKLVATINGQESKTAKLSLKELAGQTDLFKARLIHGESLDDLLPDAYALVREAAKRTIKQRHFDVQLFGGILLHQGKAAEIKTGEGKTLTATLPAYLNALAGKGVHIATVNDYLARRDAEWMGALYTTLGLTVGSIVPGASFRYRSGPPTSSFPVSLSNALEPTGRRQAYRTDITYGLVSEFGFDYLRDNLVTDAAHQVQRRPHEGGFFFALLDEMDSTLIDEARTPLIIAEERVADTNEFAKFAHLIGNLQEEHDYEVDEELKTTFLTEEGEAKLEQLLGISNLYDASQENLTFHVDAALRARTLFHKDKDYIVKDGEVVIVDEFTGRLMYGRRFTEGLHQAIEAKEGAPVRPEHKTIASVSLQSYFQKYQKLAGMSGTLLPAADELLLAYNMEVIPVPTNTATIRTDEKDRVFLTRAGKEQALVKEVTERKSNLQPLLIGSRSIEDNEHLSQVFEKAHIVHEVLNAKQHAKEAQLVAQAGRSGTVTLATNLAGRGVDILLGGNPPNPTDATMVKAAGGLVVIGTERHESKRIDDQLRGRAGRQGDPGLSVFYLSLDDELVTTFLPDEAGEIRKQFPTWKIDAPLPDQADIHSLFETVQRRVEERNKTMRVQLLRYDRFLNGQRELLYQLRGKYLTRDDLDSVLEEDTAEWLNALTTLIKRYRVSDQELIVDFSAALQLLRPLLIGVSDDEWLQKFKELKDLGAFRQAVEDLILWQEQKKKEMEGPETIQAAKRAAYLKAIDELWAEHLTELETIRSGIDFESLVGKDPLQEFKREADQKYRALVARIPEVAVEKYLKSLR